MDQKLTNTVDETELRKSTRIRKTPAHLEDFVVNATSTKGSQSNWADQVPIAVAPLNCVPYTGPPLDDSDDMVVYDKPMMVYLPEQPTEKEKDALMAVTKRGVLVTGSAAKGLMAPIMGSYDLSESDDGFLFRFALPGVSDDEKFKCEIRPDGDILIQGVTNTGQKEVQAHNMTFNMYTQYLCPPGDFEVRFHLPAKVDPSTLECKLDNGVLEGVVKKKPVQG
ncbi:putative alpha crystallin/Hsp20 domain, HSP20-like chaperone, increased DNA methylation [Helianthus annuus]|uniref:alpha-crystallin domain-containing protein 22.3 isoform X1 n=1 Tax=Helianthus annuus TaxID=4232 RepID=UPI000B8FA080|nr:alpha-crystallin domain-containing protein 22.3 isoform X1 [Helianthus annuus]KAJ0462868.1 putative alpha crystallin/Hsp20 domain, HSP20-like chaperone, increased DNA methylation [Helianthus annuus]KAJ0484214.1 putative alpha crystallin/Hsp20 domain, HSP20-like chaperone, increased DNA methylation [Helianthus annuus]KAJ0702198.1 putative alpha crystallin/Hsp20 domain, HSP20-like chaperone, increased DNA methylation [Helianthus annuus]